MKKVFIHLGLPKTGSSYLQHIFAKNSALYNQHGLIYKDFSNNFSAVNKNSPTNGNAGKIANSLIGNFSLINKSNNPTKVKQDIKIENFQYLDDFFNTLDKNKDYNHLISSESFSSCTSDSLKYFFNIISKNFECVLVAFVRNPVDQIISNYYQRLKHEKYTKSFNVYYPSAILWVKRMYNLLISFRQNIILFNYDVRKNNLINCFDNLIFNKLISTSFNKIVNPSPNYHQSEIIRLASNVGIPFRVTDAINYIENNNNEGNQNKKFLIPKSISEEIHKALSYEIKEINNILSMDEQIYLSTDNYSDKKMETLFTKSDLDFLSNSAKDYYDTFPNINKRLSSYNLYPGLPANFNVLDYILLNPDVAASNMDPIEHYLCYGRYEYRRYNRIKELNIGKLEHLKTNSRLYRRFYNRFILKLKLIWHKFISK